MFEVLCKRRKNRGFTLVEIMIVVAIIGLLTAIAIPAFLQYRKDARLTICLSNLTIFQAALKSYYVANNQFPSDENDLIGYIYEIHTCPLYGDYDWDLKDETYHVACRADHSDAVGHVCIHEDQPPEAKK